MILLNPSQFPTTFVVISKKESEAVTLSRLRNITDSSWKLGRVLKFIDLLTFI